MRKILLCLIIIVVSLPAIAVDYPDPVEEYVNDFAKVISPADTNQIRGLLGQIEKETGIEITVVTITGLADYEAATDLRQYAAQLFDKWGVGDAKRNDGVMLLFSLGDSEVWIEMGSGYAHRHNDALQQVVDSKMLPYFKTGDYSRGLYEGSRGVVEAVTRQVSWFRYHLTEIILGVLAVVCVFAGVSCIRAGKKGWGLHLLCRGRGDFIIPYKNK